MFLGKKFERPEAVDAAQIEFSCLQSRQSRHEINQCPINLHHDTNCICRMGVAGARLESREELSMNNKKAKSP